MDPPAAFETQREVTRTLEFAAPISRQCEMTVDLEYFQRDTIARVKGVIENKTCPASNGGYEIEVEVEKESGETETLVFIESWQRDDDQPVPFTAEYAIGENVELTGLRSRGLRCTCADAVEE